MAQHSVETIYFLLEKAVKFPNQRHCTIEEIVTILGATKFDAKGIKTALEFYKCRFPIAIVPLERNLLARGVLSEEDVTKPALPSFLAQILFEVVTKSATDCAEYCANVWVDRYAIYHIKPRPNDRNMPTQHIATLLGATCCVRLATVLRHVGCCWLRFENGQIWANNTQHVATCCNTVAKRTQHVAPNNFVICCVGMLRWHVAIVWPGLYVPVKSKLQHPRPGQPPGHLNFWNIFVQIPPLAGPKSCSNAPPLGKLPDYCFNFSVASTMLLRLCMLAWFISSQIPSLSGRKRPPMPR